MANPSQAQIEVAAGITSDEIANYIMQEGTPAAKSAMICLELCVRRFEEGAFGLLKAAVAECRREMEKEAMTGGGKNNDNDQKEDIRKDLENDPGRKDFYDIPDDPDTPLPPSGDPYRRDN